MSPVCGRFDILKANCHADAPEPHYANVYAEICSADECVLKRR
jgi:hypothetical protein